MPDRVTAGWNNLLCSLTTGIDPEKNDKYVDIGFMGLKGGSGAMRGTDGYDHIGMIDASGGLLDQDYEMFEQQTPHLLLKHELLPDSAGAGQWRGGLGVETVFVDAADHAAVEAALAAAPTRILYLETISNPTIAVADLPALADASGHAPDPLGGTDRGPAELHDNHWLSNGGLRRPPLDPRSLRGGEPRSARRSGCYISLGAGFTSLLKEGLR